MSAASSDSHSSGGPFDLNKAIASVHAALASDRLDEAERLCNLMLQGQPGFPPATFFLAVIASKRGDIELAIKRLRAVVTADPTAFEALEWLTNTLRERGEFDEAIQLSTQMIRQRPTYPGGPSSMGLCLLEQGHALKALEYMQRAVALAPANPAFHFHLARTLEQLCRIDQAVTAYRQAIGLAPGVPMLYEACGRMLLKNGRRGEGIWCLQRALEMAPNRDALVEIASAMVEDGKHAEAEQSLKHAIQLDPEFARSYQLLGNALQVLGRFDEADASLRRAMELDPTLAGPYLALASTMRMTEADLPFVGKLEQLAGEKGRSETDVRKLNYALGKALSDLGRFEEAMERFDLANGYGPNSPTKRLGFDRRGYANWIDGQIAACTPRFFRENRSLGSSSETPVFIIGMPRSGTTLTDQILTSHPQIGSAGELMYWSESARTELGRKMAGGRISRGEMQAAAKEYLGFLELLAPGMPRVTDKMPLNYLSLGLIHLLLPNARVIHCRRHPVATCLSMYMTPDVGEEGMDRQGIVDVYREYLRIMEHWRSVLPRDRFIEIDYEDVVGNTETVARNLISFCGLEWDDSCLRHERNTHSVRTPSKWQVRQPIYKTSIEKWRDFEPWLREFRTLLDVKPRSG